MYRKDIQGNIIAILDSNGNLIVKYKYDAWGNHKLLDASGNVIIDASHIGNLNPFRYRSYYYDTETKLYFLKTRYYDPEIGRFINMDSIDYADPETINGLNLYAYCNNNPVMNVDPEGTWSWGKFWEGVGRIALGIGAVVAGALVLASGVAGVAMAITAVATVVAGVAVTVNGAADIGEAATDYNFMRDGLFQGNEKAYDAFCMATDATAYVGSFICGGWLKTNAPRINAYKNIGKYSVSGTLQQADHTARPFQNSLLLHKEIIKSGKMINEGGGVYKFLINGTYRIGFEGKVHSTQWKLVVDIIKETINHIGPF